MEDNFEPLDDNISPQDSVASLVRLLTLDRRGDNQFIGRRKQGGRGRIYGGQVIAQALAAAQATAPEGRAPHSLHAYFLRGGDEDYPVELTVARDFDGGSFSNRRVIAQQNGTPILNLTASFHKQEDGLSHQIDMRDVPMPETLPDETEVLRRLIDPARQPIALFHKSRGYEVRVPARRGATTSMAAEYLWLRTVAPLPDDPAIHRHVIAYLSDYGLLSAASLPHDASWWRGEIRGASLDHAIWFHADVRADDWLLYQFDSPWAGGARGFANGRFYTRDGTLVASTAQEGLMRVVGKR